MDKDRFHKACVQCDVSGIREGIAAGIDVNEPFAFTFGASQFASYLSCCFSISGMDMLRLITGNVRVSVCN